MPALSDTDTGPRRTNAIDDGIELTSYVDVARRHARLLSIAAIVGALAAGLTSWLVPASYTSDSSFFPTGRKSPAGLTGLAAQLGVSVANSDATQSPAFYADLLKTAEILSRIAAQPVILDSTRGRPTTLADIYAIHKKTPALTQDAVITRLSRSVTSELVQKTGLVRVRVRAPSAPLAKLLNDRLLEALNTFNLMSRKSQASAERAFAERRVSEVHAELTVAEDALGAFERANRAYSQAPQLVVAHERLARQVQLTQQLYFSLQQSYEQARLDEIRDTPLLIVVEPPRQPIRADSKHILRNALTTAVGAAFVIFLVLAWRDQRTPVLL
jgi:uncharacterized protein involved in exopolysaccharide biosynthesis